MSSEKPITDKILLEEIKQFYKASGNTRDLLIFMLALNTGLKLSEILDLNIGDVRNKTAITIKHRSYDENRIIPLNRSIQKLISKFIEDKADSEILFKSQQGKRMDRTTVYRNFQEMCRALNLDKTISFASLRKTFGYHYYLKFKDLTFLQWLFNQSKVEETMRYIGINEQIDSRFQMVNL